MRLDGKWGVVDVDDCVNAALYLANQKIVNKDMLIIRGGSAGGYTTLSALSFQEDLQGRSELLRDQRSRCFHKGHSQV